MVADRIIKFDVIEAGRIGKIHIENLATRIHGAKVISIADILFKETQKIASRYAIPTVTNDYRKFLVDPSIGAVVICSSTDTQTQITKEAAVERKDIFCEKPIDLDLATIDSALKVVEKAGVSLPKTHPKPLALAKGM